MIYEEYGSTDNMPSAGTIYPKKESWPLPLRNVTYSNVSPYVEFLKEVLQHASGHIYEYRALFGDLCYFCQTTGFMGLLRCGGCQLVTYCSRDCQKRDRRTHKYVCKEFPVVEGKNALHTTGPWKDHIADLRRRAALLPHTEIAAKPVFRNPRVCHTCRESRIDRLTDCKKCFCVSHCSKKCAQADKLHKDDCNDLALIRQSYGLCYREDLPSLRATPTFKKIHEALQLETLSYPTCLINALVSLPENRLGRDHLPLENLTTLTVHVVNSNPLLSSTVWEVGFMHNYPKLKHLNLVFVMQGKPFKPFFFHNLRLGGLIMERCEECVAKNQVINYSIHQRPYHMFFSSPEYTEPDVVVVYGNTNEMSASMENDINNEISYRNMIHSRDTVLVVTDVSVDLLKQGVKSVYAAHPVDLLVPPRVNPWRGSPSCRVGGFSSHRADLDSHAAIVNDRYSYTCLRSK